MPVPERGARQRRTETSQGFQLSVSCLPAWRITATPTAAIRIPEMTTSANALGNPTQAAIKPIKGGPARKPNRGHLKKGKFTYAKDCRAWFREAGSCGSRLTIRSGQLPIAVIPIWSRIEPVCLSADLIPGLDSKSARRDASIEPAYPIKLRKWRHSVVFYLPSRLCISLRRIMAATKSVVSIEGTTKKNIASSQVITIPVSTSLKMLACCRAK
jgi:hypothetical protein